MGAHILWLEEAFAKVVSQDNRRISVLEGTNTPEATRELYYLYHKLDRRQNKIRPFLPLVHPVTGKQAYFSMVDYSQPLRNVTEDFTATLYNQANALMNRNNVLAYRDAHALLSELKQVQSNYKDVDQLLEEAHYKGTDFVLVTLTNRSNVIIPRRLERELLDFNTYDLDDFWTAYHSERQQGITYSFGIVFNFREIAISPERVNEREYKRKKKIKDGTTYKLDRNGRRVKDEKGNDITIDIVKQVTARVTYTTQTKAVLVGGDVLYRDLQGGRNIDKHPLASEFIFENVFARFRGDERALTEEDLDFIRNDFIPFPSNEQKVFDAGRWENGVAKTNSLKPTIIKLLSR